MSPRLRCRAAATHMPPAPAVWTSSFALARSTATTTTPTASGSQSRWCGMRWAPAWMRSPSGPTSSTAKETASFPRGSSRTSAAGGRAFNTTDDGPECHTQRGFTDAFADALGIRVRRVRLPSPVARVAVDLWARWLTIRSPGKYPGVGASAVRFLAEENPFVAERARQELGWRPVISPREAVRRTVSWLQENEKPGM